MAAGDDRPVIRVMTINMDCRDAQAMADFYSGLLGYHETWRDGSDFIIVSDPAGGPSISFQEYPDYEPPVWPERPGALWKMIHFDAHVDDLEAATAHALACGGTLAEYQGREDLRVILDPSGHPICLCRD